MEIIWNIIILGSGFILFLALVPQLISNYRYKSCRIMLKTSVTTAASLTALSLAMYMKDNYISSISVLLTAAAWWVILLQRIKYEGLRNCKKNKRLKNEIF